MCTGEASYDEEDAADQIRTIARLRKWRLDRWVGLPRAAHSQTRACPGLLSVAHLGLSVCGFAGRYRFLTEFVIHFVLVLQIC